MEAPTHGTVHLSDWQKSYFAIASGTCTPGQKADEYRAKILRIQYAWANSEISQVCAANLFKKYAEKYSAIIDSDNIETGLNNYAENILTLAKCQQNDSDKWQSALTTENVFGLKCVQERMQAGKKIQSSQTAPADALVLADKGVSASAAPCLPGLSAFSSTGESERCAGSSKCAGRGPHLLEHPLSSKSLQSNVPPVTKTSDILPASSASLSEQIHAGFPAAPLFGNKEMTSGASLKIPDGATTSSEDRILVVGATNRPQEIDEAARRRLVKRLYIPLPEASARKQIVTRLMSKEHSCLSEEEIELIVKQSDGFSGADMTQLCREASLGPIRSLQSMDITTIMPEQVRPIAFVDFESAFGTVRPSVSSKDLELYETWNRTFGCGR